MDYEERLALICKATSAVLVDSTLDFVITGQRMDWEDLRVGHFTFSHSLWEEKMGPAPTFGCYSPESFPCAIEDIQRGKISTWVRNLNDSVLLFKEIEATGSFEDRLSKILPFQDTTALFDAVFHCIVFTDGNLDLAKEAFYRGVFFAFKLRPGSRYSENVHGLFIARQSFGSYQKWWRTEPSIVTIQAADRTDVISRARLDECNSTFDEEMSMFARLSVFSEGEKRE